MRDQAIPETFFTVYLGHYITIAVVGIIVKKRVYDLAAAWYMAITMAFWRSWDDILIFVGQEGCLGPLLVFIARRPDRNIDLAFRSTSFPARAPTGLVKVLSIFGRLARSPAPFSTYSHICIVAQVL